MWIGKALRRKKTNLATALKGAVTLYAPGNYPVPYGANGVLIGGRGQSGNSPTGGNYESGGNESGGNYKAGGNTNPTLYSGYSWTDFYDSTLKHHVYARGDSAWSYGSTPSPFSYSDNPGTPGNSSVSYSVTTTHPGYTNPTYYNPSYYNPTYYNPTVPGNAGAPATIGGVTFPGGAVSSTAPTVSPTLSALKYQSAGISVTVPPGGSVTLTPIE